MNMEYRTWTSVADMPFRDEAAWIGMTRHLEREHPELGPVISWDDGKTLVVVLADDQPDPAAAAEHAAHVISDALHATGLGERFPTVFQVEPASDLIAA